jgi:hypothetical protein
MENVNTITRTPSGHQAKYSDLTFTLPRIVLDFFLNKQPDALIIKIYSVIKVYLFRASSLPHHSEFSTVHSALVSFMQASDDRFQAESGWTDSAWKRASDARNM